MGSAIAGGLIGASVIVGFVLTKSSQPVAKQTASPIVPLATATSQVIKTPQSTLTNQSFPTPFTPSSPETLPITATPENDYFWLSQRAVTDKDLDGKDGLELDIMRNWVFAYHGRRFANPGLQSYFVRKSWYRPLYSPNEFDQLSLLTALEQQNTEYIAAYQDRHHLRYFKK